MPYKVSTEDILYATERKDAVERKGFYCYLGIESEFLRSFYAVRGKSQPSMIAVRLDTEYIIAKKRNNCKQICLYKYIK